MNLDDNLPGLTPSRAACRAQDGQRAEGGVEKTGAAVARLAARGARPAQRLPGTAQTLAWMASSSAAALAPEISQTFVFPFHNWKVGTARMPCLDMSLFASELLSPITL